MDKRVEIMSGMYPTTDFKSCSLTATQKWVVAAVYAVLFLVLASPMAFNFTSSIASSVGVSIQDYGFVNNYGLILHAVIFLVCVRLLLSFIGTKN